MADRLHPAHIAFGASLTFILGIFSQDIEWNSHIIFFSACGASVFAILAKKELWRECLIFFIMFLAGIMYSHLHLNFPHLAYLLKFEAALSDVKSFIQAKFDSLLPVDQAALLGGITFGTRTNFPKQLKDAMSASGTTHLVAVSGYNITVVTVAIRSILGRILPRRGTFLLTIAILVLFVMFVGGGASSVRAGIMGFMALLAREIGEGYSLRNPIAFTALFMLLFDPRALVENIGFLLSFLALIGIVYLAPAIKNMLDCQNTAGWKDAALITVSAELMVLPILSATFGNASLTSIASNILIATTIPITMFLGFLITLLGIIFMPIAFFAAQFAKIFLGYQLFIIRIAAKFAIPLSLNFNAAPVFLAYYLLIAMFMALNISHGNHKKN